MGYDDNVLQTPTNPAVVRGQKQQVLISLGSPGISREVSVASGDPAVPDTVVIVTDPAVPPKLKTQTIPVPPPAQRIGSFVTRANVKFDTQFASRRSLFTFDLGGGVDYYWHRPDKQTEPIVNVSLIYLRRLTGRAQFTVALDASYQSQPNYSQPNTPTTSNTGSYLNTNAKADLSYRMTPRFSTVTSVGYNSTYSVEQSQQNNNYAETTFGMELRYLYSPRLTLTGELRYSSNIREFDSSLDTTSYFLLAGGELTLSRRFTASIRLGEELRTYTQGGSQTSSPYGEATLNYRLGRATTLAWNARYGLENSANTNSEVTTYRGGFTLTQIFSPRLQGSLSFNFVRSATTTTSQVPVTLSTSSETMNSNSTSPDQSSETSVSSKTETVEIDQITDTIDAVLAFNYRLSRRWGFNLSYSYTTQLGPEDPNDFYRQRVFFGAEYQF